MKQLCLNCLYSKPLEYNVENLQKMVDHYEKRIEEYDKKPAREDTLGVLNSLIGNKRIFMQELADNEEMVMCRRYPKALKVGKMHWCGEYHGKRE